MLHDFRFAANVVICALLLFPFYPLSFTTGNFITQLYFVRKNQLPGWFFVQH